MRVVQLVQKPQQRDAEVFAHELSAWLVGEGHEVATGYLYPFSGAHALELGSNDRVLGSDERALSETVPGWNPTLLAEISRFLREHRPDVVQVNGARTVKYGAAAHRFGGYQGFKLVYRNIDSPVFWVRGLTKRLLYSRLIMPELDGIVGVSEKTLAEVVSFYGLADTAAEFIPNGVDFKKLDESADRVGARAELGAEDGDMVMLFLGSLSAQKRPERFLRVVAKVLGEHQAARAWIVGDGPDQEALAREAANLGIAERTHFLGFRADVGRYLSAADVLVSTSDTEGIPAVMLEASYLELPVVAFDVGGVGECVLSGRTGVLVAHPDEHSMAARLVGLARDPDHRRKLGRQAHEFVTSTFGIQEVGSRYLSFYQRVLAG